MHEFALAEAVVATALEAADHRGIATIRRLEVHVGELQRIRKETFEFALREVLPSNEPRLAGAHIDLVIDPARFRCRACDRGFGLNETEPPGSEDEAEAIHFVPELAHSFLRCPGCRSPDFEVLEGRGVTIEPPEGD
jgi:hydrogenase nickel incorporation protein HypA/HybF